MYFNRKNVEVIIETVGEKPNTLDPDALAADLEHAATMFDTWRVAYDMPTRDRRIEIFGKIERRSLSLARLLGVQEGADPIESNPSMFAMLSRHAQAEFKSRGPGSITPGEDTGIADDELVYDPLAEAAMAQTLKDVWRIHRWARAAREEAEDPSAHVKRMVARRATVWLIAKRLPEIFKRQFGQPFGVSKSQARGSRPYGPGIRFVTATLKVLDIEMSPDAIEKTWDRYRGPWDTTPDS